MKRICIIILTMSVAAPLFAQNTQAPASDALLRALLEEIRALRITMQKNSAHELRGRLLIERARMYQENIRELSRELEQRPPDMEEPMEMDFAAMEANIESRAVGVADKEEQRRMIEREKRSMEKRREMQIRHREQMRQRYQQMEARLAEEKEKLSAVEDELDRIQKELTGPVRQ